MKNSYLINKNYLIKEDLESLLFYYDHFSQGLTLPKNLNYRIIKQVAHSLLRLLVIFTFVTKLYKIQYSITQKNSDAIILIKGPGNWKSNLEVLKTKDNYIVRKRVHNKQIFEKEMKFYNLYKDNKSKIKLPRHVFKTGNIIEIEFLPYKSFQRQILDGTMDLKESIYHMKKIIFEVKKLYRNKRALIHGDMWPGNIYIYKNNYYLIDYSDSHKNNYEYDIYVLLFSLLCSYQQINDNEKSIINFTMKNKFLNEVIKNSKLNFQKVEQQFIQYRQTRFPGVYY